APTGTRATLTRSDAALVLHLFRTRSRGYQFWSGIGSDVGEVTLLGVAVVWWRTHNCHVHRCWHISWHPHPVHGHPVCRKHYPNHKQIGLEESTSPTTVEARFASGDMVLW